MEEKKGNVLMTYSCFGLSIPLLLVPQIKTGAPCRSERLSKYNQLMR